MGFFLCLVKFNYFVCRNGRKRTVTKTTEKKPNGDVIVHEVVEEGGKKDEKTYQLTDGNMKIKNLS